MYLVFSRHVVSGPQFGFHLGATVETALHRATMILVDVSLSGRGGKFVELRPLNPAGVPPLRGRQHVGARSIVPDRAEPDGKRMIPGNGIGGDLTPKG